MLILFNLLITTCLVKILLSIYAYFKFYFNLVIFSEAFYVSLLLTLMTNKCVF